MAAGEHFEDLCRDLCTRVEGLFAIFQNVTIRIRQPLPQLSPRNFDGKVCIVTGGNAGVGQATAQALVARGARVIIACRDKTRARAAAKALDATPSLAGCEKHPVETGSLDLASLDSVRAFASGFNKRSLPLALLICNAGIMAPPTRLITKDGLEQQFQVNYLGHWLLTYELLAAQRRQRTASRATMDSQRAHAHACETANAQDIQQTEMQQQPSESKPALHSSSALQQGTRVVMLSSLTHRAGRIRFDDLGAKRRYSGFHRYADSKLAELLAVKEFAQRLDRTTASGVHDTIVAVHPGLLQTQLAKDWLQNGCPRFLRPLGIPIINFLFPKTFLPPEYAVQSILMAATAPAQQVHGRYVAHSKVVQPARQAKDDSVARRLWDVSCQLANVSPHAL